MTLSPDLPAALRRLPLLALDALLPPRCLACGATVDRTGMLCGACWGGLDFLAPPLCHGCGYPFDYDLGAEALCGACSAARPAFARARAVLRYDDASRRLLLAFKYRDRTDGAPAYGRWLARAAGPILAEAEAILPVPLHRWRLLARRYNQSALLARALARESGLPLWPDALVRTRNTPSQGRLGLEARRRNVAGAFAVPPRWRPRLAGLGLLLVDDVLTSGATAEAATKALLRAGAARVDVLTLARVVRPRQA